MPGTTARAAACLLVLLPPVSAYLPAAPTQEREARRKAFDEFHQKIGPRWERIEADLKAGRREPWEGRFENGAPFRGLDRGVIISRKHGYVSTSRRIDMGIVKADGDRIALVSEAPDNAWGLMPREYVVVPWDGQVFLVEPDDLVSFCNDVNSGRLRGSTPGGGYLLPAEDFDKPRPTGMPKVPAEYKDYLLRRPIAGGVVKLGDDKEDVAVWGSRWLRSGTSLTLGVGKKHGVRAGMRFYPERDGDAWIGSSFYVISLGESRCELLHCGDRKAQVKVGLRLTTAHPLYDPK